MFPNSNFCPVQCSIAILVTGLGTPIVLTWAGYLPFLSTIFRKLKPYLVWPSLIGTYQVRPLPSLLGNAPTVGQTLYILIFLILNIVLTAVNFQSRQPNAWYSSTWHEIMAYVLYRTGAFAYIIAPLIWLFAGRNNILLWASNWSHSTFLVLHRWVARIFTLQVLLHSIIAVILYKAEGTYGEAVKSPYWIWGIVATLCCVLLIFGSGLYLRNYAYEFFLLKHIVLSVVLIVGCWYHAYDLYKYLGGYEDWLIATSAIWMFDRLGRVLRIAIVGPHRAKVTVLNEEYSASTFSAYVGALSPAGMSTSTSPDSIPSGRGRTIGFRHCLQPCCSTLMRLRPRRVRIRFGWARRAT